MKKTVLSKKHTLKAKKTPKGHHCNLSVLREKEKNMGYFLATP
tara:strand:- start:7017 stop:7145 length:129 start_codon:yes stop_codon:yes gene_type:complete